MISPEQAAFLAEANVAVLSTVDGKGRPHAAPVWYLYEGGELIVSTGLGSQKHRNVQRNPNVSLVVDRRTLPYFALMVTGAAEIEDQMSEDDRYRLAERYIGEEFAKRYMERVRDDKSVTLRIKPDKVIEFNGRAGRS